MFFYGGNGSARGKLSGGSRNLGSKEWGSCLSFYKVLYLTHHSARAHGAKLAFGLVYCGNICSVAPMTYGKYFEYKKIENFDFSVRFHYICI